MIKSCLLARIALMGCVTAVSTAQVGQDMASADSRPPTVALFTLQALESGQLKIEGFTPPEQGPLRHPGESESLQKAPQLSDVGAPKAEKFAFDGYRVAESTSAPDQAAVVDVSAIADGFMTAATPSSVDLSWAAPAGSMPAEVYRDDLKIATVTGSSYHDMTVQPGQTYEYRVEHGTTDRASAEDLEAEARAADDNRPEGSIYGATVKTPHANDVNSMRELAAVENAEYSSGNDS